MVAPSCFGFPGGIPVSFSHFPILGPFLQTLQMSPSSFVLLQLKRSCPRFQPMGDRAGYCLSHLPHYTLLLLIGWGRRFIDSVPNPGRMTVTSRNHEGSFPGEPCSLGTRPYPFIMEVQPRFFKSMVLSKGNNDNSINGSRNNMADY